MTDKVKWRDAKALRDRIEALEAVNAALCEAHATGRNPMLDTVLGIPVTEIAKMRAENERLLTVVKFVAEMDDLYPESNGDAWKAKDMARAALAPPQE